MSDFLHIPDDDDIRREKNKARELRKSQWWKRKCAKGICYYCKKQFTADELTMDHVVPLSRGGKTEKNNVVACCKACNTEKKSRLLMDWQSTSPSEIPD